MKYRVSQVVHCEQFWYTAERKDKWWGKWTHIDGPRYHISEEEAIAMCAVDFKSRVACTLAPKVLKTFSFFWGAGGDVVKSE